METNQELLRRADPISLERIKTMHPHLREELRGQYLTANAQLPETVRLRVTQAHRTAAEQDALWARGRTAPGKKVTNARAWQSMHNYGLAFDIVLLRLAGGIWTADWTVGPEWKRVAGFFKDRGWAWGGDWPSFPDPPHFEKTHGRTWQALQGMPKKRDENGIEYPLINGEWRVENVFLRPMRPMRAFSILN